MREGGTAAVGEALSVELGIENPLLPGTQTSIFWTPRGLWKVIPSTSWRPFLNEMKTEESVKLPFTLYSINRWNAWNIVPVTTYQSILLVNAWRTSTHSMLFWLASTNNRIYVKEHCLRQNGRKPPPPKKKKKKKSNQKNNKMWKIYDFFFVLFS